jgi:hypothetical protein
MAPDAGNDEIILLLSAREYIIGQQAEGAYSGAGAKGPHSLDGFQRCPDVAFVKGLLQYIKIYGVKSLFICSLLAVLMVVLAALALIFTLFNAMAENFLDRSMLDMNADIVAQMKRVFEETLDESARI